jgi:hypothetical protein
MGLLSFLFGGKKDKAKAAPKLKADQVVTTPSPVAYVPVSATAGVIQAKLRLKLAASLRAGEHAAAYEAAKSLADIQIRAGRKTVARSWQQQAERIKAQAGLAV